MIKKLMTLAVMLLAMATSSLAQAKFGVKGGLNVTKMSFDAKVVDSSNQTGFFFGPTVKFTLPIVSLGIDAAALYDQRSNEIEVSYPGETTRETMDAKMKSIQIPVNVRFGFGLGDAVNIYVFAGPQFGFTLGDKVMETKVGDEWTFSSSTLSGNAGFGLFLLNHLQISANYNFALGKTGEFTSEKLKDVDYDGKMNSWQIALCYYF